MADAGYYSELLSYVVGPKGHVLLLNNTAYDHWSEGGWEKRLAGNRLPNVEHRTVDFDISTCRSTRSMRCPDQGLSRLLLGGHRPEDGLAENESAAVLDQLARVLKPGGILLLEDHSAKAGTGSADAGTLHRIDEAYTVQDFEKRGFKLIGKSDLLRRPDDERELVSYTSPGLGKTDRFLLVFRKNAS